MSEKNFSFVDAPENSVITIREGRAPDIISPTPLNLTGLPGTIVDFLTKRQVDLSRAHLIVNRPDARMDLAVNENGPYIDHVIDNLLYDPHYLAFLINRGGRWNEPANLARLFKRMRRYFSDKDVNAKLVSKLKNFSAEVHRQFEKADDQKGNKKLLLEQQVNADLEGGVFELEMPVFRNGPLHKFVVEICVQTDGESVVLWLESVGAEEVESGEVDRIIDAEVKEIRTVASELVIVEV